MTVTRVGVMSELHRKQKMDAQYNFAQMHLKNKLMQKQLADNDLRYLNYKLRIKCHFFVKK